MPAGTQRNEQRQTSILIPVSRDMPDHLEIQISGRADLEVGYFTGTVQNVVANYETKPAPPILPRPETHGI